MKKALDKLNVQMDIEIKASTETAGTPEQQQHLDNINDICKQQRKLLDDAIKLYQMDRKKLN